ncbi:MAG: hypothetical protein QHG98_09785, partial [Methanothrix sp.]|nr:hypothetical protein [Methanothrix sp.]
LAFCQMIAAMQPFACFVDFHVYHESDQSRFLQIIASTTRNTFILLARLCCCMRCFSTSEIYRPKLSIHSAIRAHDLSSASPLMLMEKLTQDQRIKGLRITAEARVVESPE